MRSLADRCFLSLICFAILLIASASSSASLTPKEREQLALIIKKGAGIHVIGYQKESNTYVVRIEGESDVGPNITTPEWLLEGVGTDMSLATLKRKPTSVVGSYFRLKKILWLLDESEVRARTEPAAKK